jgi:predicted porin
MTIRKFVGSLDGALSVSLTDSSDKSTNGGIRCSTYGTVTLGRQYDPVVDLALT